MPAGSPPTRIYELPGPPVAARAGGLAGLLTDVVEDRAAEAREVALATSRIVQAWMHSPNARTGFGGADLERALAVWNAVHGWRGACALWLDALRRAWAHGIERNLPGGALASVAEEARLWSQDSTEDRPGRESATRPTWPTWPTWNGEPLAPGLRWPSREAAAAHAAAELGVGESVLLSGWSEVSVLGLEHAWRAGKRPEVIVGEGLPALDGRRLARRLVRWGIPVTMVFDAALAQAVPRADRVWIATEAIGADALLARVGSRALAESCEGHDVPLRVLATSDDLVPGGLLSLPASGPGEDALLWEDPPEGVRLEACGVESIPLALPVCFLTEAGLENAATLHLRALRTEPAPRCDEKIPALSGRTA